jgi:hypothetical protein
MLPNIDLFALFCGASLHCFGLAGWALAACCAAAGAEVIAAAGANASSAEIVNTRTMKSPIPLMSVCRQIMLGFEWGQLNQA